MEKLFSMHSKEGLPNGANEIESTTTGFIVSSEGQHKYPGKKTMIPNANGRITMSKVGYPVLGIDDLGNSVMMQPCACIFYGPQKTAFSSLCATRHFFRAFFMIILFEGRTAHFFQLGGNDLIRDSHASVRDDEANGRASRAVILFPFLFHVRFRFNDRLRDIREPSNMAQGRWSRKR